MGPYLEAFRDRDSVGPALGLNHRIRVLRYACPPDPVSKAAKQGEATAQDEEKGAVQVDQFEPHFDQVAASGGSLCGQGRPTPCYDPGAPF